VSDELSKLSGLEPVSPEFNVTRTYLEWLTNLPWGVYSEEVFDINHAQQVRGWKRGGEGAQANCGMLTGSRGEGGS
jgi:hypothetical protein